MCLEKSLSESCSRSLQLERPFARTKPRLLEPWENEGVSHNKRFCLARLHSLPWQKLTLLCCDSPSRVHFATSSILTTTLFSDHEKTHTKPHKCRTCKRGFALKKDLKRHEKTHSPDRRWFRCKICDSKLTREDALMRHMRDLHTEEVAETDDYSQNPREPSSPTDRDSPLSGPATTVVSMDWIMSVGDEEDGDGEGMAVTAEHSQPVHRRGSPRTPWPRRS